MCYATWRLLGLGSLRYFFIEVHLKFITVQVDVTTVLRCIDGSLSKGVKKGGGGKWGGRT